MRKRPKTLILLSLFSIGIALSFPLQIMAIYGHGFGEISTVFSKLTILNWCVMLGCLGISVLILRASASLRWALPALLGLVALNDFLVGHFATDFSPLRANLATLTFAAVYSPLLQKEIRDLIRSPERRWWRAAERKRAHVPIFLGGLRQAKVWAETFDLSASGVFVAQGSGARSDVQRLNVNEYVSIRLTLGTLSQIRCEGRVVRKCEARGNYPAGVGIEFCDMPWMQRRELKRYLARPN